MRRSTGKRQLGLGRCALIRWLMLLPLIAGGVRARKPLPHPSRSPSIIGYLRSGSYARLLSGCSSNYSQPEETRDLPELFRGQKPRSLHLRNLFPVQSQDDCRSQDDGGGNDQQAARGVARPLRHPPDDNWADKTAYVSNGVH
jgi:hypothetical protein